ncbi:MAG: 2-dehydropantoate 2-reductase [Alphaproteobacteria bacterium]|nr:2-dehydropantoate 2-reductase [Alphaproteobacteria bacterium]
MKIVVVGAGAMGAIYAGLLAENGHEVWACDTWQAHLDAMRDHGLRVEGASGDRVVTTVRVARTPAEAGAADLYIVATKASGVEAAARAIAPLCRPSTMILTIQNGLGSGERMARHVPAGQILLGVADGFGASVVKPGHVHHNAMKLIRISELAGGLTARVERMAELWRGAGFKAQAYGDISQLIWEKFLCNVTFSAPCTVFGCTLGQLMSTPEHWEIALGGMAEAYALGRRKSIAFSFDNPRDYVTAFGAAMPNARPSMLLDHLARRPSEIDAINGMVPVLGREMGIPTPFNDTLVAVVRAREAEFARPPA